MRKKDILVMVIALIAIGASVFFMLRLLSPKKDASQTATESENIPNVPSVIDEATYKNVETLSDYGTVTMQGIGKTDLFAGF